MTAREQTPPIDEKQINAYRLFQRMMRYPALTQEMRTIFLDALEKAGLITRKRIHEIAEGWMQKETRTPELLKEYESILVDYFFANAFGPEQIEGYINLARKNDKIRHLTTILNREGTTTDDILAALREFCDIPEGDIIISTSVAEDIRVKLINHFISNHLRFIGVAKNYITIRDLDEMTNRTFRSPLRPGKIGGKAAGMLLAYKILLPRYGERDPELEKYIVLPESYYFTSGIFSEFIEYNGFYAIHSQKYKDIEDIEREYHHIEKLIEGGAFPPHTVQEFRNFLEKIGENPIILRSSTLLEDNEGYSFSGKYESVFLANQGDIETRLNEFIQAFKQVHISTYSPAPIVYRQDHNLLDFDERMSVLVQKVVGKKNGDYFFPFASGVAFSYSEYRWNTQIRKEDGQIRLVFGLGTRAVDRVGSDYPRMVPLSHPTLRPEVSAGDIQKYSQKVVDVINLKKKCIESIPFQSLEEQLSHQDLFYTVSQNREGHMAAPLFLHHFSPGGDECITFENFITQTPFVSVMKKVLKNLEKAYGHPVDVEFAWDDGKLYLLQCRPLAVYAKGKSPVIPSNIPQELILFLNTRCIANAVIQNIDTIVYVDPKAYSDLRTYEEKLAIARAVGKINRGLKGRRFALFGPGRWGSNDINLGVKVRYSDINKTLMLGEVAFEKEGSTPEVSYGTHFFNDLVEARITPVAFYPDRQDTLFKEDFFLKSPSILESVDPELTAYSSVIHVIDIPSVKEGRYLHVIQNDEKQTGIGYFGPRE